MKHFKPILPILASLGLLSENVHAQNAASYAFKASAKTYDYINGKSVTYAGNSDDKDEGIFSPNLGFSFYFCGKDYKQVSASTNGWLSFLVTPTKVTGKGAHWYPDNTGDAAKDVQEVSPAVFPFWDNLNAQSTGTSSYTTIGKDRNRVFIYEWKNWGYTEGKVDNSLSMQVRLYETGGIEFRYKKESNDPPAAASGNGVGATIGIAGSDKDYQTLNDETATAISSSATYTTDIDGRPATDQSFMWFPKNGVNDAGVIELATPSTAFCEGTEPIRVKIMNFGTNQIKGVTVNWEVDGIKQQSVTYNPTIDTFNGTGDQQAEVFLGNVFFGALRNIKIYTSNPNGSADIANRNDTLNIYLGPSPRTDVATQGPTIFCSAGGLNVPLKAPQGTSAYQWYRDGNPITGATQYDYIAKMPGIYTVKIDSNGCSRTSAAIQVENLAMPQPTVTPSGNPVMCDTIILTANANVTGATYQWFRQGILIPGATGASYTAKTPANYHVETNKLICTASSPGVQIQAGTKPMPQITEQADGTLMTDATYASYQWKKDNVNIPGATLFVYKPTQSGSYTVVVSNGGCDGTSDPKQVNTVGIDDINQNNNGVLIYPNPATTVVNVKAPTSAKVHLITADGRTILQQNADKAIDLSSVADGLYLIRVTDAEGNQIATQRLIKKQ